LQKKKSPSSSSNTAASTVKSPAKHMKDDDGKTPLDWAEGETADLIRKHGGKTGEELKAE
jgi:hypothetical protein